MKCTLLITITVLLFCSGARAQKPPDPLRSDPADLAERVQRLEAEVKTLREALMRLQLTLQKAQVVQRESELQAIQAEKQKADQRETARLVQLQQVTTALANATMDAETRAETEGLRTALTSPAPAHKREELDRREREVAAELEREQTQWRLLLKQARELGLETSSGRY